MHFQVSALPESKFSHLYGVSEETLKKFGAKRIIADSNPGFPCRVSMRDAEIGETLILLNYFHHDKETPYRASHAIFVIEGAKEEVLAPNSIPPLLHSRLLSVRAFDKYDDMIAAEVCEGSDLEQTISNLGSIQSAEYLHVHNAAPGCYAARIDFVK